MFPESPVCTLYDDTKRNGFWVTGGEPGVIEVLKVWKWPIVHRSKFWPIYLELYYPHVNNQTLLTVHGIHGIECILPGEEVNEGKVSELLDSFHTAFLKLVELLGYCFLCSVQHQVPYIQDLHLNIIARETAMNIMWLIDFDSYMYSLIDKFLKASSFLRFKTKTVILICKLWCIHLHVCDHF